MVYYLSSRRSDEDSGQYGMEMSLSNLEMTKIGGIYPAYVVLGGIPIATLILIYILLVIIKPGMCCKVDEKDGRTVFSPGKAFGISFVFALIAFAATYMYMKTQL